MRRITIGSSIILLRSTIKRKITSVLNLQLDSKDQHLSTLELPRVLVISIQDTNLTIFFSLILICLREPLKTMKACHQQRCNRPSKLFCKKIQEERIFPLAPWLTLTTRFLMSTVKEMLLLQVERAE